MELLQIPCGKERTNRQCIVEPLVIPRCFFGATVEPIDVFLEIPAQIGKQPLKQRKRFLRVAIKIASDPAQGLLEILCKARGVASDEDMQIHTRQHQKR